MFERIIACYFGKLNSTLGSVVPLAMFINYLSGLDVSGGDDISSNSLTNAHCERKALVSRPVQDYNDFADYVYDDYHGDNHSVKFDDVHIIGESTFLTCGLRGGVCSRGSHRLDISTQWEPW